MDKHTELVIYIYIYRYLCVCSNLCPVWVHPKVGTQFYDLRFAGMIIDTSREAATEQLLARAVKFATTELKHFAEKNGYDLRHSGALAALAALVWRWLIDVDRCFMCFICFMCFTCFICFMILPMISMIYFMIWIWLVVTLW